MTFYTFEKIIHFMKNLRHHNVNILKKFLKDVKQQNLLQKKNILKF